MDITTVTDDLVVIHEGTVAIASTGWPPTASTSFFGVPVRTLDRPRGALRCRFATVNDVHFGEVEAGRIDDHAERSRSSVSHRGPSPIPR